MIFQFTGTSGQVQNVMRILEQWGFVDAFLPFLLLFVLIFAILNRLDLFKAAEGKRAVDARRLNGLISFAISLMVVLPHMLGRYPKNYDPILLINTILPGGVVILMAVLVLLLLLGMTGLEIPNIISVVIGLVAIAILGLIIAVSLWPSFAPGTILQDPSIQALIIILLVMGIIVWFVSRPEATEEAPWSKGKSPSDIFKEIFKKF